MKHRHEAPPLPCRALQVEAAWYLRRIPAHAPGGDRQSRTAAEAFAACGKPRQLSSSTNESSRTQGQRCLEQRGVGEGLGVVAEMPAGCRIHFFGEEPKRAGERTELIE